ncbi:MAG TPA: glycosyltransferase, partial [Polyangiaceae bacterium]|nr:glycosyltransferase [Polyangiaceae bacterium]
VGSYGDVIPFVAIAEALRKRAHAVRVCSWRPFERLFRERNIEFSAVGSDFDLHGYSKSVIASAMSNPDPGTMLEGAFDLFVAFEARRRFEECRAAMVGADAAVCNALDMPAQAAAESVGIPWFVWTSKPLDRDTLPLSDAHFADWDRRANFLLERETGVQLRARAFRNLSPYETYFGVSEALLPGFDPPPRCFVTGTCFLDDFVPAIPEGVLEFLNGGDAPLVVTFGAFGELLPDEAFGAVIEAVRRTNVRAIVHAKRRDSLAREGDGLLFVESLPYAAVFPRARAVLHHGGAGTTATVCRAGVPSATLSYIDSDQAYWAAQIHGLGVATEPLMLRELDVEALHARLNTALNDGGMRRRAVALAPRLRSEDGAANIVSRLESFERSRRAPPHVSVQPSAEQRERIVHGPK